MAATEKRADMGKTEKKVVEWITAHLWIIFLVAVTICSMIIRFNFRAFVSLDYKICLAPWWNEIYDNGKIFALKKQVGDYNMLYQFLIAVMTYIPMKPLYQYKILSIIFDYLLAGAAGSMIYDLTQKNVTKGVLTYTVVIMSPVVFMNSSAWAQCDAIYTFFVVLSLIYLMKERYIVSFIVLGVAFAFKLQAVFILPFYMFYYFWKKKFSIWYFLLIPFIMCVMSIPNFLMGRNILDLLGNYMGQVGANASLAMNYPSFWCVFNEANSVETLKVPAVILTIIILGSYMYVWIKRNIDLDRENILYCAFIVVYTCVLFLPMMHERYGYIYEILAILIAFVNRKTIMPCVILNVITLITYNSYLYEASYDCRMLGAVNLIIYMVYLGLLMPLIMRDKREHL